MRTLERLAAAIIAIGALASAVLQYMDASHAKAASAGASDSFAACVVVLQACLEKQ